MAWNPDLITVDELCAALDIVPSTLYRWRKKGIAPAAITVGRHKLLFKREDVDAWIEGRRAS